MYVSYANVDLQDGIVFAMNWSASASVESLLVCRSWKYHPSPDIGAPDVKIPLEVHEVLWKSSGKMM